MARAHKLLAAAGGGDAGRDRLWDNERRRAADPTRNATAAAPASRRDLASATAWPRGRGSALCRWLDGSFGGRHRVRALPPQVLLAQARRAREHHAALPPLPVPQLTCLHVTAPCNRSMAQHGSTAHMHAHHGTHNSGRGGRPGGGGSSHGRRAGTERGQEPGCPPGAVPSLCSSCLGRAAARRIADRGIAAWHSGCMAFWKVPQRPLSPVAPGATLARSPSHALCRSRACYSRAAPAAAGLLRTGRCDGFAPPKAPAGSL